MKKKTYQNKTKRKKKTVKRENGNKIKVHS